MNMAFNEFNSEGDRELIHAISKAAKEFGDTSDRIRKQLMADHAYDQRTAQLAVSIALSVVTSFSAKLLHGESFADCKDLDEQILQAIRDGRDAAR
jgi:hypothetical protein